MSLAAKLAEGCGSESSECEERHKNKSDEFLAIHVMIKLLIDETLTLPKAEQDEDDNKNAYCFTSSDEREEEIKMLTRQTARHKDAIEV